jgi:hypothetical protein
VVPEPRLAVPLAARPLTLPRLALRLDLPVTITSTSFGFTERKTFMSFAGGLAVGATDDLELGALLLPLQLAPDAGYRDPGIYGAFRFVEGVVELGVVARLRLNVDEAWGTQGALALQVHATPQLRIDARVGGGAIFYDSGTESFVSVPLALVWNPTPRFFVGAQSGLDVVFFGGGEDAFIVAGAFVGTTVPRKNGNPSADLRAGFFFPNVQEAGELFQVGFSATFFFFL